MTCTPDCGITLGGVGVAHTGECVPAFEVIKGMQVRLKEKEEEIRGLKVEIYDLERRSW